MTIPDAIGGVLLMKNMIHIPYDETVLWEGTPDKKVSIFEGIFNPLLVFAAIWLIFDLFAIVSTASEGGFVDQMPIAGFFAIHLAPVWIYLFGAITSGLQAKHTRYVVTDRAVYIQKGIFTINTERSPLNEVMHTGVHCGVFDQFFGTGDVVMECVHEVHKITNIRDFNKVCDLIARTSQDQYTDTMYPNDRRPDGNDGYQTKYYRWRE